MTPVLEGRVALVTGACGGLGRAISARLRAAGARVALSDLDKSALDSAVHELGSGDDVAPFALDLTDDARAEALPDRVRDRFGRLDVLVNNAGTRQVAPILELTPTQWRGTLDIDLTAPFVLSRAAIPGMIDQGHGKIVNIASMAGHIAFGDRAAYCAAKAGVIMLTRTIAYEFGSRGIWCNAIAPGVVETPLTSEYFRSDEMTRTIRTNAPMGRWGQADEIAGPVLFLSGPDSDYVNGTTLFADGGWTAGKGY
ncbi:MULTISPECIES: SDR family NAD(P)-dependent oxidoreductase [Pseudonocardia]|uniref:3-oxoacyl-[acyl-carrier-protein] reductase FabG n=2 Tax=Pseudonocardia TaxID=1847 RepID=A0A1Y2MHZ6_PSEAH|nr:MULTISPECIES: SDR family NAD(P)-dependent oxidoreductase [Pseudonocardia]OSY34896.1 3-oxoacyl-[acyl-carrier-protein] reductase FabG [Pseudonocardia autotrophica]TDN75418.1 gluconate 5-dehydrogenase/2-deoxy-D-gluconate 3-dehydrogenase [Pseudonocardia autotrophica]BBF99376.1 gluconate 5-dehydrogenase [Pseudonocardia autotrophica]GEC29351.1 gluconate 5-dehydrogenase [Pseudonocardia saturnea]